MNADRLRILLVEDNYEHLTLTKYILNRNGVNGDVFVVRDGQEAMDYLYHRNSFSGGTGTARPSLVLLDLNTPRLNGRELLKIMKADQGLRDIPVVIVSSSDRPEDVAYAREHGASAYISKSAGFEEFSAALKNLDQYMLPGGPRC
jgi:two-component system response regulator